MFKKILPPVAAFCLLALSLGTALAHERRETEEYNLVYVTKVSERGHGEEPITGVTRLESALQVEVAHIPSGATRLHAFSGDPGHYKSDFILHRVWAVCFSPLWCDRRQPDRRAVRVRRRLIL